MSLDQPKPDNYSIAVQSNVATQIQPLPISGDIDVAHAVTANLRQMGFNSICEDIEARVALGEQKYGSRLKAFNGRDVLTDLGQEVLDAINYAKQAEIEGRDDGSLFQLVVAVAVLVEGKWKFKLDGYQENELWDSLLRSIDEIIQRKASRSR
jgi:hypothetical protein